MASSSILVFGKQQAIKKLIVFNRAGQHRQSIAIDFDNTAILLTNFVLLSSVKEFGKLVNI